MIDHHDHHDHHHDHLTSTGSEDEAFLNGASRIRGLLMRHRFVAGFLAVGAAALLFLLGISAGETLYLAVDGDDGSALAVGAAIIAAPVAIVAIGVALDRRRRTHHVEGDPPSDA